MSGRKRAKGYAPWRPQERTMDLVHRANDAVPYYEGIVADQPHTPGS